MLGGPFSPFPKGGRGNKTGVEAFTLAELIPRFAIVIEVMVLVMTKIAGE